MIDQKNDKIKISYSLMSKDNKDFTIPDSLVSKILDIEEISSIVYTNTEKCAPGVINDFDVSHRNRRYNGCLSGRGILRAQTMLRWEAR